MPRKRTNAERAGTALDAGLRRARKRTTAARLPAAGATAQGQLALTWIGKPVDMLGEHIARGDVLTGKVWNGLSLEKQQMFFRMGFVRIVIL